MSPQNVPDPSGAARAPQNLTEHEAVLQVIEGAFEEIARICDERWCGKEGWRTSIPAQRGYDSDLILCDALVLARSQLGALVQAVEDQQRVGLCPVCGKPSHSKCNHCGEEFYTYRESLASTNERLAPVVRELKAEVAQLRAEGQRLRDALRELYRVCTDNPGALATADAVIQARGALSQRGAP